MQQMKPHSSKLLPKKFTDWLLSFRQFSEVPQMVAVPARQGRVAGVFKQKFQRRRFDVAGAKDHVGFALPYQAAFMASNFPRLMTPRYYALPMKKKTSEGIPDMGTQKNDRRVLKRQ